MRRCFLFLLLSVLSLAAPAQSSPPPERMPAVPMRPDSLRARLARPGLPDTTRVKYLLRFSTLYLSSQQDSSRLYARQALRLAQRRGFDWGAARAWSILGAVEFYATDITAAQQAFEQALRLGRRLSDTIMVGRAYIGLGNVANELHNAPAFVAYYAKARQAYAACRPRYVSGELLVAANLANYHLLQGQPALARQALRPMPELLRLQPAPNMEGLYYAHLGAVQLAQHQPDSARQNWLRAVQVARAAQLTDLEAEALRHLAKLALDQHQPALALPYTRQAARAARAWSDQASLAKSLRLQADALAALHRPGAYDTLSRYATLRDTLLTHERVAAVATAQARFDRKGQEARIAGLEKDRLIQALEAERRATRTRLLGTGGALAASLLLGGIVLGYRRRQKAREAALRHRLAADLHDDLGPLLTQLAVESSLLRENVFTPAQLLARLQRLGHTSQQAAQHLGDVLRDLDQGPAAAAPAPVGELVQQLREQAHESLSPHELSLLFTPLAPGLAERLLPAGPRHALTLIFREALHNVVKHAAGATLVQATLAPENNGLQLTLHDDGQAPTATLRPGGRGLRNMHTRAAALGGRCAAGPAPGGGYQVRCWLPA
ncbi:histidine kinase [Hymenobacter sp. ASUV-10]|uniref:histidine kinase n=1 Tax=Hymenobacter aranciens TaxID=3063996 RepID=A0ABT9B6B6_9BACT|nr:histidine kinase [Hymenobacter sp. ASUV-10]MDO7873814.1 histidine kinase [Hymenobacter sp. ASUV-10]